VVSTTPTNRQTNSLNISTASGANDAISTVDFALSQLNKIRGGIGAVQNRFNSSITSLQVASENLSAARSRIRDADVAAETVELTKNQILVQAGLSVLAQANQLPSVALTLLGG
jgi:flagellin